MQPESSPSSLPPAEVPGAPWYLPLTASPVTTLVCVAAFVGLGVVAAVMSPAQHLARGTIILPNAGNRAGSSFASVATSLGLGAEAGSLPMFTAILKSERMLNSVSQRAGVPRKRLRKDFGIRDDAKSNTIEVYATATSPDLALRIVRSSLLALSDITAQVNLPGRRGQAQRLSASLANRQRGLAKAEIALKEFLSTAKVLPGGGANLASQADLGSTSDTASTGAGDGVSIEPGLSYGRQLSSLEIELRKLDSSVEAIRAAARAQRTTAPLDLPPVRLWADKIADAEARLAALKPRFREGSPEVRETERTLTGLLAARNRDIDLYVQSVQASLSGPAQALSVRRAGIESQIADVKRYAQAVPGETIRYLRLARDVKLNEQIVSQIRLQYERARLEQTDDPNTWSVLDVPAIDEEYDAGKTKRNVAMGALLGSLLAYGLGTRRLARKRT